jgi:hypothetical protein
MTATEPDYIVQNSMVYSLEMGQAWMRCEWETAERIGMNWVRVTVNSNLCTIWLLEAWKDKPDDEGPPRFMFN